MRLFQALCRRKKLPGGNIWLGKYRIVREVTKENVGMLRNSMAIEERNMFLLRHSYLTPEQSAGHAKALGKREEHTFKYIYGDKAPPKGNVTIEDGLCHLRYNESWE